MKKIDLLKKKIEKSENKILKNREAITTLTEENKRLDDEIIAMKKLLKKSEELEQEVNTFLK